MKLTKQQAAERIGCDIPTLENACRTNRLARVQGDNIDFRYPADFATFARAVRAKIETDAADEASYRNEQAYLKQRRQENRRSVVREQIEAGTFSRASYVA